MKYKMIALLTALALLPALFTGCMSGTDDVPARPAVEGTEPAPVAKDPEQTSEPVPDESPETPIDPALKELPFDEALLRYLSEVTEGSYMASPLSFRYALGLLLAGASGDTRQELMTALGIETEEEWAAVCAAFNDFAAKYEASADAARERFLEWQKEGWVSPNDPAPSDGLRVANSVWKRENIPADFTPEFREKVAAFYAADYFSFAEENAVRKINAWADEKTNGLIPEFLPEDYDVRDLAVVLMNALYFKDSWVTPFPEYRTEDGDFTLADGTVTEKTYMKNLERFPYYEDADTQLVVLPLQDGVSMAYVLGSTENLWEKLAAAETADVELTVPKIDLETSFIGGEFVDFLKALGVNFAFDPDLADFSAMLAEHIWVDDIIQKTRLKTDETGLEAAAVTAIMAKNESIHIPAEPKIFTADRPFSFFIYADAEGTDVLMFAGEIVD